MKTNIKKLVTVYAIAFLLALVNFDVNAAVKSHSAGVSMIIHVQK